MRAKVGCHESYIAMLIIIPWQFKLICSHVNSNVTLIHIPTCDVMETRIAFSVNVNVVINNSKVIYITF